MPARGIQEKWIHELDKDAKDTFDWLKAMRNDIDSLQTIVKTIHLSNGETIFARFSVNMPNRQIEESLQAIKDLCEERIRREDNGK